MSGRAGGRAAVLVAATAVPATLAYLAASVYRKGRRAPAVDGSLNGVTRPPGPLGPHYRTTRPGPCCHPSPDRPMNRPTAR